MSVAVKREETDNDVMVARVSRETLLTAGVKSSLAFLVGCLEVWRWRGVVDEGREEEVAW